MDRRLVQHGVSRIVLQQLRFKIQTRSSMCPMCSSYFKHDLQEGIQNPRLAFFNTSWGDDIHAYVFTLSHLLPIHPAAL